MIWCFKEPSKQNTDLENLKSNLENDMKIKNYYSFTQKGKWGRVNIDRIFIFWVHYPFKKDFQAWTWFISLSFTLAWSEELRSRLRARVRTRQWFVFTCAVSHTRRRRRRPVDSGRLLIRCSLRCTDTTRSQPGEGHMTCTDCADWLYGAELMLLQRDKQMRWDQGWVETALRTILNNQQLVRADLSYFWIQMRPIYLFIIKMAMTSLEKHYMTHL